MTTKDRLLCFKNKQQCFVNDKSQTGNRYSNLNLKQNQKCSDDFSPYSKSYIDEYGGNKNAAVPQQKR
jgi:hypothetical protein